MTAANLYKQLINKEISREKWLYEVRRDEKLPWITNLTSFDDSILILKQKGIIKEEFPKKSDQEFIDPFKYIDLASQYTDEDLTDVANQQYNNEYEIINIVKEYIPSSKQKEFVENAEKLKKTGKSFLNESKKENIASKDRVNFNEYLRGLKYELEQKDDLDLEKAENKVLTNLAKEPLYYTYLLNDIKPVKKRTDLMEPLNKKKDNLKAPNQSTVLKKNEKINVKDKKDKKKKIKIKTLTMNPKAQKGIKTMEVPKKAKKIKLKESYVDDKGNLNDFSPEENPNRDSSGKMDSVHWMAILADYLMKMFGFNSKEALNFIRNNKPLFFEAYRGGNDPVEAVDLVFSYLSNMNEDLYKEKDTNTGSYTGSVQSFNPSNPSDKKIINDPKFRIKFKKIA